MSNLQGKFVWFEHVSDDVDKARSFYGALFGWSSDSVPMGDQHYPLIKNGADPIGGFRKAPPGVPNHWISYLSVADVDASAKATESAGGKVLVPPTDYGEVGRGAVIADPTGAVLSIWKAAAPDRPDADKVPPGDWYWNECWTPDDKRALVFYEKVFGFGHDAMDMGPMGTYYVLKKDGRPRGGLMKSSLPGSPPGWLPYVSVTDCDAAFAKARSLGARGTVPPKDIPNVGRFAIVADPVGAVVAVIRPQVL